MIRVNLLNKVSKMSLPAKLFQWLPYIAIPVAIFLGMTAWSQHGTINRLEDKVGNLEAANYKQHLEYMKMYTEMAGKIEGKIQQGKEQEKVIKIDIGKTIKEFNRDIKDTKKIDNAADSVRALSDVWSK
jgi:hypothetical protein